MKLWPFTRRASSGPSWEGLTASQRRTVVSNVAKAALGLAERHYSAKGFEVVKEPFASQRRPSYAETGGEDSQISPNQRNRMIGMQRDMLRNSPTRATLDQQLRVNVVGHVGGKLYASFPEGYGDAADAVMRYFNRVWAPRAEFSFGKSFNWLLKTALTSMDANGNLILVFDDGILTGGSGTGRIRGFEGDEIAAISDADFLRLFPSGWRQSAGFAYDPSGVFSAAFVSTSQRGCAVFPSGKFITLRRDGADGAPCNWTCLGDMRRFNQGRAVSPLTSALATLVDLHETVASETLAAKLNAQLVGQILESADADVQDVPAALRADDSGGGDSDGEQAAINPDEQFATKYLNSIGIGAHFNKLPPGLKMELLDTKRPNVQLPAYVDFLTGLAGGTRGLARVYATLKAQTSYTAFRGEQVMTWPSFEEVQKELERDICDWAARLAIARAVRTGEIVANLPEGWEYMLAWQWPKMREVNQTDAENAFATGLRNGSVTFFDRFGPDWENRCIRQRAIEAGKFRAAGLVYPGDKDQNGQPVSEPPPGENASDNRDKEEITQETADALWKEVMGE